MRAAGRSRKHAAGGRASPAWPLLARLGPHSRDCFPARDLVDLEPYRKAWKSAHGFFSLNLVSSRGCPYRCNWCAKPIYGSAFHARSAQSVAQEMKLLKEQCGAEHLWFADDIFALRQSWAGEL